MRVLLVLFLALLLLPTPVQAQWKASPADQLQDEKAIEDHAASQTAQKLLQDSGVAQDSVQDDMARYGWVSAGAYYSKVTVNPLHVPIAAAPPPWPQEVYSWQDPDGDWMFSLHMMKSGPYTTSAEVYDKKFVVRGVKKLKEKLLTWQSGSSLYWRDQTQDKPPKGSPPLRFPPQAMLNEIRHFAKDHGIRITMVYKPPTVVPNK